MHQVTVLKQVAEPEQSQEQVQLTELVPMKRSHINEDVLKDVDATDGLKALRSISNDYNDKSESFDVAECRSECKSDGKHQQEQEVSQEKRSESQEEIADSDDEGKNGDKVTEKKTEESRVYKEKNNMMIARKKPTRSCKETDDRRKRNNGLNRTVSQVKRSFPIAFEDDDFAPEDNDEELYCNLNKESFFKDEVYVYRQESVVPCPKSANEESDQETREEVSTDSATDYQENTNDVTVNGSVTEERNSNTNGITEKVEETFENELKTKSDTERDNSSEGENNNCIDAKKRRSSEEICATAGKPSKFTNKHFREAETKELSDGITKNPRPPMQNWQKSYHCVVCYARFQGSGGLRNHYKIQHSDGPKFKCDVCGRDFPLKDRLRLHMRIHTGFKPYKCPDCDKCFARGGQLTSHRRTHTKDKPFHCDICNKNFACGANLTMHKKRHNGQKDHKCHICGRGFVRRDALRKHLQCLHNNIKSFVCVICNKTFKGHLPQHMRTHAQDRPYTCATCGRQFAQKSQLTVHQRVHNGERPFRCLICWQAFAHSTALNLHLRCHTGERPFKCTKCDAEFTQLPHWKKHLKCVHGQYKPYSCKWCSELFKTKSAMENHRIAQHPETTKSSTRGSGCLDSDCRTGIKNCGNKNCIAAAENTPSTSINTEQQQNIKKKSAISKYRAMSLHKMRLLLAVLLQRISKEEKLKELGFGKRLIDEVLQDSLVSAGKQPVKSEQDGLSKIDALTRNLEILLEWTVPKKDLKTFRKMNKTPEDILQALTESECELLYI